MSDIAMHPSDLDASATSTPAPRLGERLVAAGKLSERDLHNALQAQHELGGLLGQVLVQLGVVAEADVAQALAEQLHLPWLRADDWAPFSSELRKINIMQAISAAVNTTRNKISHGLVLSFSIILLYRYSSINLYYSTQPA